MGVFDIAQNGSITTANTRGAYSTYAYTATATRASASWDASTSEFYFGFGVYKTSIASCFLMDFLSPNGTLNVRLQTTAGSQIAIYRSSGNLLGTCSSVLAGATWVYIEGHLIINDTTGTVEIRVNGVAETITFGVGVFNNQDTRADAAANGDKCDRLEIGATSGAIFDDVYMNDTTGTQNIAWAGDIRITAYIPNAAGDVTGMTPTAGANYTNVDERPPNDATDIVAATGTTLYDLYALPDTSGIGVVQAVTLWLRAQKSDAGTKNIAHMIKSGATENQGSDIALSTSWTYYRKNYNNDPTDSTAWSAIKVDGLQIGAKAR
jgi:hypothetical protein